MTATEPIAIGGDISNDGAETILMQAPFTARITITGDSAILFHRWSSDAVQAKADAAKGSRAKKTDDISTYVWRNDDDLICLPGEYLRGTLIDQKNGAAKYQSDPRSPRKSALDLFRAGVVSLTDLAPITRADGTLANTWDYLDRRRAVVQRNAITRERPAFYAGWSATIELMVVTPQYITPSLLRLTLNDAGRLVGVGDFRPSFGRFSITRFEVS